MISKSIANSRTHSRPRQHLLREFLWNDWSLVVSGTQFNQICSLSCGFSFENGSFCKNVYFATGNKRVNSQKNSNLFGISDEKIKNCNMRRFNRLHSNKCNVSIRYHSVVFFVTPKMQFIKKKISSNFIDFIFERGVVVSISIYRSRMRLIHHRTKWIWLEHQMQAHIFVAEPQIICWNDVILLMIMVIFIGHRLKKDFHLM